MPSKPAPPYASPVFFALVIFALSWFLLAAFIAVISWMDVNEWLAIAIGGGFCLVLSAAVSLLITGPLRRFSDETTRERRQTGEKVRALELEIRQAQAILESMAEGVCALDGAGRIVWLNRSAEALFGVRADEAKGKRLTDIFRQPDLEEAIAETLSSRQPSSREAQAFGPSEQAIRFQAAPCEGFQDQAAVVVVAQDVTEIRKLERLRRDFVANVSHELKTPLTSIKGLVETLLNGALEDASNNRRFVTLIDEDATRLSRLIDDLLELSQVESKGVSLRTQPVDLRNLLEGLATRFRNQAEAQQVRLEMEIPQQLPAVLGDPDKLRQVFVNLMDNAIKFNRPQGKVSVCARISIPSEIAVAVSDTGAGIPEVDLPRIFERFYRVDKARSRELGGTGLGLAIVKHLVELHHGRITVASRLGEGTTITVFLPLLT